MFETDTSTQRVSSIGLGLLWQPSNAISASLHWGHALDDDLRTSNDSLQDNGIHVSFSWTPWNQEQRITLSTGRREGWSAKLLNLPIAGSTSTGR
jgi:hypothetical protein